MMQSFNGTCSGVFRTLFGRKLGRDSLNSKASNLIIFKGPGGSGRNFSNKAGDGFQKDWQNYREISKSLLASTVNDKRYAYDVDSLVKFPKSYDAHLRDQVPLRKCLGLSPLFTLYANPVSMISFATKYLLSYRFFFIYMARTTFQAVRPLLAFCVFGEIMKLILANISGGIPAFLFSFVLAFEVLYFFLQCYISYTFLAMFFTVMF